MRHQYLIALVVATLAALLAVPAALAADAATPGSPLNSLAVLLLASSVAVAFVAPVTVAVRTVEHRA